MPQTSLANTKTAGNDEVLATLQYLSRLPSGREGASLREITIGLQRNGHYGPHAQALSALEAQVQTVLTNLITLGYVATTTRSTRIGEGATTGYVLTRAGVLPSRRTRPQALRP
jgi:hypothetical protein